jgi:hypothetical protein
MRYRVAHRRAAAQSGLTQVLGGMNRYSAIGYAITAVTIAADLAVLRGAISSLVGTTALLVGQTILLALIPAAILLFIGARRSTGRVQKFFGYSFFALDVLLAISACAAVVLIVSWQKAA